MAKVKDEHLKHQEVHLAYMLFCILLIMFTLADI